MTSSTDASSGSSKGIMATRIPALLVTHADLASALLRAAEQLTGPVEGVAVLSNEGLSGAELETRIGEAVSHVDGGRAWYSPISGAAPVTSAAAPRCASAARSR